MTLRSTQATTQVTPCYKRLRPFAVAALVVVTLTLALAGGAPALAGEPLDEPTANLDSRNGAAILDLMRRMNEEQQVTFLFSTHDPQVMERARRVVRLVDGRVVSDSAASPG